MLPDRGLVFVMWNSKRFTALAVFSAIVMGSVSVAGQEQKVAGNAPFKESAGWLCEYSVDIVMQSGSPVSGKWMLRKIVAAAAPDRFYHYVGHYWGDHDWKYEPFNQEVVVNNGECVHSYKFNRQFSRSAVVEGGPLPGTLEGDMIFFVLPAWPLTIFRSPRDSGGLFRFVVDEVMNSDSYVRVGGESLVGGQVCIEYRSRVAEDRLWLAKGKSGCVMKRMIGGDSDNSPAHVFVTRNIAEVSIGVWRPKEIHCTVYAPGKAGQQTQVEKEMVFNILRWEAGEGISDDLFVPRFPAGSIMVTGDSFEQVSGGGTEHIEKIADYCRAVMDLPKSGQNVYEWRRVCFYFALPTALWSTYIVLLACSVAGRFRRRHEGEVSELK